MLDQYDDKPFIVRIDGTAGPYLMVVPSQVDAVKTLLERNGVAHTLESEAIRMDSKPATAIFNLGADADVAAVEKLLADV